MYKKKLLFISGAGASLEFGMPSVQKIDTLFENWALSLMPLVNDPPKSLYTFIKEEILQYYSQGKRNKQTNFEELLYVINMLSAIHSDNDYSYAMNAILKSIQLPTIQIWGNSKIADSMDLKLLHSTLVDKLLDYVRQCCCNVPISNPTELATLMGFFSSLQAHFDISVLTVNYDDVFLQALSTLETGFDTNGDFDPKSVINNNWNFYYSLHGSVHFDMKLNPGAGNLHDIKWESNLRATFQQNSSGRNTIVTMEGLQMLTSNIIAGYDKSNQILRDPFKAYFCQIPKIINEADSYLFCGYGFADRHLNSHLENIRATGHGKKIVILDYADNNQDRLRFRNDEWSWAMTNTLIVDPGSMGTKTSLAAPIITDLKTNKEFEVSHNSNLPLAVWYDGFLSACNNAPKVIDELL